MALKNKMRGHFQYQKRSIPPLMQEPPNPSRKCKFFSATLKDVFCNCHRFSNSILEDEYPTSELELEHEVVVSEIRTRAMEKLKQRTFVTTGNFSWVYSPTTGELFISPKPSKGNDDEADDGSEEYLSVGTCFSCCASDLSRDDQAFHSARTNFSRCSSLAGLEFQDFPIRSILQELCHCEGWPFGLCRKALLLPPLPQSPSESWSWRKGARIAEDRLKNRDFGIARTSMDVCQA